MSNSLSNSDDDDMSDLIAAYDNPHEPIFAAVRNAIKGKRSTMARANAAMTALDPFTAKQCAEAYAWGDNKFAEAVATFPRRLPIQEHTRRVRALQLTWVWPLRYMGGITRYIERKKSHAPADAHWHRFSLDENRTAKAKSEIGRASCREGV